MATLYKRKKEEHQRRGATKCRSSLELPEVGEKSAVGKGTKYEELPPVSQCIDGVIVRQSGIPARRVGASADLNWRLEGAGGSGLRHVDSSRMRFAPLEEGRRGSGVGEGEEAAVFHLVPTR